MADDNYKQPETIVPANDDTPPNGDAADTDIPPWEKFDRVVLDIARLIGRQMAREDFELLRAATANDNAPRKEADKD